MTNLAKHTTNFRLPNPFDPNKTDFSSVRLPINANGEHLGRLHPEDSVIVNGNKRQLTAIAPANIAQARIEVFVKTVLLDIVEKNECTFIPILEGALLFYAAVIQHLPQKALFMQNSIKSSAYGDKREAGSVKIPPEQIKDDHIRGRTCIIIEDVLDTGVTIEAVKAELIQFHPKEIITIFLVRKYVEGCGTQCDHWLFDASGNMFLVGFGLDDEYFLRHRNTIYDINSNNYSRDGTFTANWIKNKATIQPIDAPQRD